MTMIKLHPNKILIRILLLLLIFVAPIPLHAKENSLPILFKTFGRGTEEILNLSEIKLDSIAINNIKATMTDVGDFTVYKDDAVRIGGRSKPEAKVTVMFGDKKIDATADYGGDWFVLFSITNMIEGKYVVNAKTENSDQTIFLVNLIVGQGNRVLQPTSDTKVLEEKTETNGILLYIALAIGSLSIGWFLRTYYEKYYHRKRNIKQ
jgi:hypothetical protein